MKTLHLTLKKKWFDMIASGEKKEEYRDIKSYWINRFTWHEYHKQAIDLQTLEELIFSESHSEPDSDIIKNRFYECVEFKNGYSNDAPTITLKCLGITIGVGKPEWGAEPGVKYFVISFGEIIK